MKERLTKKILDKIKNQKKLAEIAKQAVTDDEIKIIDRITAPNLLAELAKNGFGACVQVAAIKKITDQNILIDRAKNAYLREARIQAMTQLADKSIVADIANNEKDDVRVRIPAAALINDQSVLENIALNHASSYARSMAMEKLTNNDVLIKIIDEEKDKELRNAAVKSLTDRKKLNEIADGSEEYVYIWEERYLPSSGAASIYGYDGLSEKEIEKLYITETKTLDLRETAHKRLAELENKQGGNQDGKSE